MQIADVEGAIGADPAVAGGVLKVANSSYYRAGAPVNSLRSACMRLGIPRVLALAREAVVASLLPKAGGVAALADEVWDRGVVARRIARDLAPKVRLDADTVADVMLLHDVGELALLRVLGDVLGARKLDEGEEREVRRILARNHEGVGALVLKSWGMPGELVRLAVCHHGSAPSWTEGAQEARLRALVRICDQAAEQTLGDHDQDPDEVALEALGLPMSEVTRVSRVPTGVRSNHACCMRRALRNTSTRRS